MRITLVRDGKRTGVDVAADLASATIDGWSYPVTVVARSPSRVELEVAGRRIVVDGWPEHFPDPPGPVDVDGERWTVGVERGPGATAPSRVPSAVRPTSTPAGAVVGHPEGGTAVVPPIPGRVIEVRVREGERVTKGTVLLVLEAMKMRNEVPSPVDGIVRDVRVRAGGNTRAREPMLFVVPG